jgi:hypothetical protein
MLEHLQRLEALRAPDKRDADFWPELVRVKRWQHLRLRHCYADLLASPRYTKAAAFFLDELYGENDCAIRDRDLMRMYPTMKRLLPEFAFNTVTNALALDVLAEEFDQAMAKQLRGKIIDTATYAAAFQAVGRQADRLRQVQLMRDVGQGLDMVVKKPLIYTTLKMLRQPSKLAGLGEMQRFLEAGFTAFRQMKGADEFLGTIATRETALIEAIFAKRDWQAEYARIRVDV